MSTQESQKHTTPDSRTRAGKFLSEVSYSPTGIRANLKKNGDYHMVVSLMNQFAESENHSLQAEVEALKADKARLETEIKGWEYDRDSDREKYNKLGIKFDQETERWQQRDSDEVEKRRVLESLNAELVIELKSCVESLETENGDDWYTTTIQDAKKLISRAEGKNKQL